MTNISKHPLDKNLEKKLFLQLIKLFSSTNRKRTGELFSALLSPVERTMLVKRLAVVIFIREGVSSYRIAKMLKMSESSVGAIRDSYDSGRFDSIIQGVSDSGFDIDTFLKTVEQILYIGFPSRAGEKRWQLLDKINGLPNRRG